MRIFSFILVIILCASCTGMLWDKSTYTENIHSLYIEEKSSSFVALGASHHYVFSADKEFLSILKASKNVKMTPLFYNFKLSKENNISGEIDLYAYKRDLSDNDVFLLKGLGFDDSNSYNRETLKYVVYIKGIRYAPDPGVIYGNNLSKSYRVVIVEPSKASSEKLSGKILLTPVTVAADDALVSPLGVLYGVFQIFK